MFSIANLQRPDVEAALGAAARQRQRARTERDRGDGSSMSAQRLHERVRGRYDVTRRVVDVRRAIVDVSLGRKWDCPDEHGAVGSAARKHEFGVGGAADHAAPLHGDDRIGRVVDVVFADDSPSARRCPQLQVRLVRARRQQVAARIPLEQRDAVLQHQHIS